ncbi:hypothetical protein KJ885_01795 [Patescibacteria group bacterium]|nr:hypothetical protein [Patescibacteria group bacterium]
MPKIQQMQCDCGTETPFVFHAIAEIVTCQKCEKKHYIDAWGNQWEATKDDHTRVEMLERSANIKDIRHGMKLNEVLDYLL